MGALVESLLIMCRWSTLKTVSTTAGDCLTSPVPTRRQSDISKLSSKPSLEAPLSKQLSSSIRRWTQDR